MTEQDPAATLEPQDGLVTVTLTEDGTTQQYHGRLGQEFSALTVGNHRGTFTHHRDRGSSAARRWVNIEHAVATAFRSEALPFVGRDWEFGMFGLAVCLEADQVTVEPITAEGRAWLRANESPWEARDRLLARFAEFDAEASEELELIITELVANAREDGEISAQADHL